MLSVKNENESAWHRAYREKTSKNKKGDALNKSEFYAQMFTCKLFLSALLKWSLLFVKRFKLFCSRKCKTQFSVQ